MASICRALSFRSLSSASLAADNSLVRCRMCWSVLKFLTSSLSSWTRSSVDRAEWPRQFFWIVVAAWVVWGPLETLFRFPATKRNWISKLLVLKLYWTGIPKLSPEIEIINGRFIKLPHSDLEVFYINYFYLLATWTTLCWLCSTLDGLSPSSDDSSLCCWRYSRCWRWRCCCGRSSWLRSDVAKSSSNATAASQNAEWRFLDPNIFPERICEDQQTFGRTGFGSVSILHGQLILKGKYEMTYQAIDICFRGLRKVCFSHNISEQRKYI